MSWLWIVAWGTLGCVSRWGIEEVVERRVLSHRPYATMAVNILGAAIAGFVVFSSASVTQVVFALPHTGGSHLVYSVRSVPLRPLYGSLTMTRWSPYLLTGFCGGFTTFSSAIAIPALDWHHGHRARGVILMGLTPVVCVAGFWIGELMSKIFF